MIKIEFWDNAIKVTGHANADFGGNDIYCAGVSAIVNGAINWFDTNEAFYEIDDGLFYLKIKNKNLNNNKFKLELLKVQLWALNHKKYKKYLKFIVHNKEE